MTTTTLGDGFIEICNSTYLPLIKEIKESLEFAYENLGEFASIDAALIPSKIYDSMIVPAVELMYNSTMLVLHQFVSLVLGIIQPIAEFLGIEIDSAIPPMKIFNFSISEMITKTGDSFKDAVKQAKEQFADFTIMPNFPDPLFEDIEMPEHDILLTMQESISDFLSSSYDSIMSLMESVTGDLEISFDLTIPEVPSLAEIRDQIFMSAGFGSYEDFVQSIKDGVTDITEFFSTFELPGFDGIEKFTDKIYSGISSVELEMRYLISNLYTAIHRYILTLLIDYCLNVLGDYLNFVFPLSCFIVDSASSEE